MKIGAVKVKYNGDKKTFDKFLKGVVKDYLDVDPLDTTAELNKEKKKGDEEECA